MGTTLEYSFLLFFIKKLLSSKENVDLPEQGRPVIQITKTICEFPCYVHLSLLLFYSRSVFNFSKSKIILYILIHFLVISFSLNYANIIIINNFKKIIWM